MEKQVLSAVLQDRHAYEEIKQYVEEGDLSDIGAILYQHVVEYYDVDREALHVDLDLLKPRLERNYPKHYKALEVALDNVIHTSSLNVSKEFLELKKGGVSKQLAQALLSNSTVEVEELMEKYDRIMGATHSVEQSYDTVTFQSSPIQELLHVVRPENMVPIYPKVLNERVGGGVPWGTHIVAYARPEMGKSALAINMAAGFCFAGVPTLYVGNEDPHNMMLLRFVSRMSGMTRQQIMDNPDKAQERATKKGYDNLVFASMAPGSMSDIRRLLDKHYCRALVIDQLHNLQHREKNKVEKLEMLATEARNITKERELVTLSLTQAADSAEGKVVLDKGDVYYSNTGIPGQCDIMIGIGADAAMEQQDRRMLSLAKNKIGGDHTPVAVRIDRHLSRVLGE